MDPVQSGSVSVVGPSTDDSSQAVQEQENGVEKVATATDASSDASAGKDASEELDHSDPFDDSPNPPDASDRPQRIPVTRLSLGDDVGCSSENGSSSNKDGYVSLQQQQAAKDGSTNDSKGQETCANNNSASNENANGNPQQTDGGQDYDGQGCDLGDVDPIIALQKMAISENPQDRLAGVRSLLKTFQNIETAISINVQLQADSATPDPNYNPNEEHFRAAETVFLIAQDHFLTYAEQQVRLDLLEQIPSISLYCIQHPSFAVFISRFVVRFVLRLLSDSVPQVRKSSQAAILILAETNRLDTELLIDAVIPELLQLTAPTCADDIRVEALSLLCKLFPPLGKEKIVSLFLPRFTELCLDSNFNIRKVCASCLGEFSKVLGQELSERVLVPHLVSLSQDNIWNVRKSCAECFTDVSLSCSMRTRRHRLAPVFIVLLADSAKWVQCSAFQTLGPFISTFADSNRTGLKWVDGELVFVDTPSSDNSESGSFEEEEEKSSGDQFDTSASANDPPKRRDSSDGCVLPWPVSATGKLIGTTKSRQKVGFTAEELNGQNVMFSRGGLAYTERTDDKYSVKHWTPQSPMLESAKDEEYMEIGDLTSSYGSLQQMVFTNSKYAAGNTSSASSTGNTGTSGKSFSNAAGNSMAESGGQYGSTGSTTSSMASAASSSSSPSNSIVSEKVKVELLSDMLDHLRREASAAAALNSASSNDGMELDDAASEALEDSAAFELESALELERIEKQLDTLSIALSVASDSLSVAIHNSTAASVVSPSQTPPLPAPDVVSSMEVTEEEGQKKMREVSPEKPAKEEDNSFSAFSYWQPSLTNVIPVLPPDPDPPQAVAASQSSPSLGAQSTSGESSQYVSFMERRYSYSPGGTPSVKAEQSETKVATDTTSTEERQHAAAPEVIGVAVDEGLGPDLVEKDEAAMTVSSGTKIEIDEDVKQPVEAMPCDGATNAITVIVNSDAGPSMPKDEGDSDEPSAKRFEQSFDEKSDDSTVKMEVTMATESDEQQLSLEKQLDTAMESLVEMASDLSPAPETVSPLSGPAENTNTTSITISSTPDTPSSGASSDHSRKPPTAVEVEDQIMAQAAALAKARTYEADLQKEVRELTYAATRAIVDVKRTLANMKPKSKGAADESTAVTITPQATQLSPGGAEDEVKDYAKARGLAAETSPPSAAPHSRSAMASLDVVLDVQRNIAMASLKAGGADVQREVQRNLAMASRMADVASIHDWSIDIISKPSSSSSSSGSSATRFHCPHQDIIPQELLDNYLSMVDPNRAQLVETDISQFCAYNLPAVAFTIGRQNWPCLRDVYRTLANDMQWKVRRTLAFSTHRLATILGADITEMDVVPVFTSLMRDVDEVRVGILKHLAEFVKQLNKPRRRSLLQCFAEFLQTDNTRNWRFRHLLAEQLTMMCSLYDYTDLNDYFSPIAMTLAVDKVAEVRTKTYTLVAGILWHFYKEECTLESTTITDQFLADIIKGFAQSQKWTRRQTFIYIAQEIIRRRAIPDWKLRQLVLPALARLAQDKIANIRVAFAKAISATMTRGGGAGEEQQPLEESTLGAFDTIMERMLKDPDRDVCHFADAYFGRLKSADGKAGEDRDSKDGSPQGSPN